VHHKEAAMCINVWRGAALCFSFLIDEEAAPKFSNNKSNPWEDARFLPKRKGKGESCNVEPHQISNGWKEIFKRINCGEFGERTMIPRRALMNLLKVRSRSGGYVFMLLLFSLLLYLRIMICFSLLALRCKTLR
jgi:hypothetical protein